VTQVGYLGLGSNVGNRRANLERAVEALPGHGISVTASSSVYETEPVLVPDQRDFYNACLRVETAHDPERVLDVCKAVERELGRPAGGVRYRPRLIDVDVLLLDGRQHSSARLTLPHPELRWRRFVLVPLLELDPQLTLPDGTPVSVSLATLGYAQRVRLVGPPLI
jgi:2-amino-4-hydroxy-6-hydroxymethyldihydropteridine diphosphokinase